MVSNTTNLVLDQVLSDGSCGPDSGGNPWTYNQGVMISALADMATWFESEKEREEALQQAIRIANATMETLQIDGILTETACENKTATWCNND